MALTTAERKKVRYHLGYPLSNNGPSIQLGIGRPLQTSFMVDNATNNLDPDAETEVRRIVKELDCIEVQQSDARSRFRATQLGTLHTNIDEPAQLDGEYKKWAMKLADTIGAPLYAFSDRFKVPTQVGGDRRVTNAKVKR